MATTSQKIATLKRDLAPLRREEQALEDELQELRRGRERLKRLRDRKKPDPATGNVPSVGRIKAYTSKIGPLVTRLDNVQDGIAWRVRVLRRLEKSASSTAQGKAATILELMAAGKVRAPLALSTGGTSRRDFVQLAELGRVRVPATGAWVTPTRAGLDMLDAIIEAGRSSRAGAPCDVNALVGGVHSANSKHYRFLAFDTRENDSNTSRAVRAHDGVVFDEDPYHDHDHFGGGPP